MVWCLRLASRVGVAVAGVLAAAGCVVVIEEPEATAPIAAVPVAVPFGATPASATPHDVYYESVVGQLQHAWLQRDRAHMAGLLEAHDRPDAPDWARERLDSFRRILRVMEFETVVQDRGQLDLPASLPALGEPLALTIRLGPLPSMAVRLLGGDEPARTRFVLLFRMFDRDSFGTQVENASTSVVDLPATIDFCAGESVQVPVAVEVPAAGSILRRVSVEVFLMPGHIEIEGMRLPNRRVRCAVGEVELLPRGHDRLAAQPLAALKGGLLAGDGAHFPHVYLAARELARQGTAAERAAAVSLLIDRARLGRHEQACNALAALALLEPAAAVHNRDRTEWLQWWARRESAR